MPTDLPPALYDDMVAAEMPPAAVGRLARSYHEATVAALPAVGNGPPRPVRWLHPRAVWAARVGTRDPRFAPDVRSAAEMTASALPGVPGLEHVAAGPDVEPWCRWLIADMLEQAHQGDPTFRLALRSEPVAELRGTVDAAERVLGRVWPEAAVGNRFLVRSIVHVVGGSGADGGPEFRSATWGTAFGAILAGVPAVDTVPAAFELLLHEGGHLDLYLRNAFVCFVTNPHEMVGHPLRTDPRPMSGTVHAGRVLARMATGFTRWCEEPGVPDEAVARRDDAVAKLSATLDVLRASARWTPAGARWFADLEATEAALAAPVPA